MKKKTIISISMFASLWLVMLIITNNQYEEFVDITRLDENEREHISKFIRDNNIKSRVDGSIMSIESGHRKDIVLKMTLDQKIPKDKEAFIWLSEVTNLEMTDRLNEARAKEIEAVIESMDWVDRVNVVITKSESQRAHKAMVSVNRSKDKHFNEGDLDALRSLVSFAVPQLPKQNIGIVVDYKPYILKKAEK